MTAVSLERRMRKLEADNCVDPYADLSRLSDKRLCEMMDELIANIGGKDAMLEAMRLHDPKATEEDFRFITEWPVLFRST